MPWDARTVRPASRLALVAGAVVLPLVAILCYSYALVAGALVVLAGWLAVVLFWRRIARERSAPGPGARWRMAVWVLASLFVAAGCARLALWLSAWPGDPAAPEWPAGVTGTLIGVLIVSGLFGLALVALLRPATRFPVPVCVAAAIALVGVPWYLFLNLEFRHPEAAGWPVLAPEADYDAELSLEPGGTWVGDQRFRVRPHGEGEASYVSDYLVEAVDEAWAFARARDEVQVLSARTAPFLGPDDDPAGLSVTIRGPVPSATRRLGLLRRSARVEPTDPPVRLRALGIGKSRAGTFDLVTFPVWAAGMFERSRVEVRLPGNAFLMSCPAGGLTGDGGEDRVEVEVPWPPPWPYLRFEPFRPHLEIVYLPALRFAWLQSALRGASTSPRAVALFALLIWPAGLAIFVGCRGEIERDLARCRDLWKPLARGSGAGVRA